MQNGKIGLVMFWDLFDPELRKLKKALKGKILAEVLTTKINRHKIVWVGRSQYDNRELRLGVEFQNGNKYFYDWKDFASKDSRFAEFEVLTPAEVDALETKIKADRAARKKKT